ncbi:hypothetical protein ACFWBB_27785 [Streptomyces sp. NPDC060000]|uniref:hypothetical protein n=1 Tax=Streptomyces sp. NPDC060000 TaxID=3347031 RepID=UPI0036C415B8
MHSSPEFVARWWTTAPAHTAFSMDSSYKGEQRVQERLGTDPDTWWAAVALLGDEFPDSMAELADTAKQYVRTERPCPWPVRSSLPEGIPSHVRTLISWAPEPALDRIVDRLGPDGRLLLAEQTTYCSTTARALVKGGEFPVHRELAKDRERDQSYGPHPPAPNGDIITALLERDDPALNLWMLQADRIRSSKHLFDVLTGVPFAPGRTAPVHRLPETLAFADRIAELVDPWELARHFESSEPEHILLALAAEKPPGQAVLWPYQQLVAGLLLARSDRIDLLTRAQALPALHQGVGEWYAYALSAAEGAVAAMERAVSLHQQRKEFFEEARDNLFHRHLDSHGQAGLDRPDHLLAHSRALSEDPWYPIDWDAARRWADAPAQWNERGIPSHELCFLADHADCPADLVRRLVVEDVDEYVFLHLFRTREDGLDLLRTLALTRETAPLALWAAVPDGDWQPEITVEDVLRQARPAHALLQTLRERFSRGLQDYVRAAATPALEELLHDCTSEQRTALDELLPTFSGTLPELIALVKGSE